MTVNKTVFRYTEGSEPIDIEPCSDWINYGDVNPERHGGTWIRWNNDHWDLVRTKSGHEFPDEFLSDDMTEIIHAHIYPDDVFVDGNPNNGPTDYLEDEIESLSRVDNYEQALVDEQIEWLLYGWLFYYGFHRNPTHIETSEYWDYLERHYGIEQSAN